MYITFDGEIILLKMHILQFILLPFLILTGDKHHSSKHNEGAQIFFSQLTLRQLICYHHWVFLNQFHVHCIQTALVILAFILIKHKELMKIVR